MKFVGKLNIIFLAAIMLLVPLADMAICADCFSPPHSYQEAKASVPTVISSAHCPHCKPSSTPLQSNSVHLCPICNNSMPLLSSTNPQVNLPNSFFCRPEKITPALEIYSIPYVPPRNI